MANMQQTMMISDEEASRIHRANELELLDAERRRWDSQIRAERVILFLGGAVAGVMCAVAVVVMK